MTLTALIKLSDRFGDAYFPRIAAMLAPYKTSCQLQAQQRACEYTELLKDSYGGIREQLLDRMPPLDIDNAKARRADEEASDSEDDDDSDSEELRPAKPAETSLMDDLLGLDVSAGKSDAAGGDLLGGDLTDVMDIFNTVPAAQPAKPAQAPQEDDPFSFVQPAKPAQPASPFDILNVADLTKPAESASEATMGSAMDAMMGSVGAQATAQATAATASATASATTQMTQETSQATAGTTSQTTSESSGQVGAR